jgi:hypothetical protein
MTPRMQAYQFMTQKQQDILDDNNLWDELNEMVSEVTITNESEWNSFWNMATKSPWMIIE